ncbi:cell division protein FtsA [Thermodesulforhabdus norvegica]|uniref:Cell division protein FtsA n=1 Tax=Thermodesulforhabdus norvegica TaxID=39841 RepID=A0A1I4SAL7_9BACT|nr:cell division protein FtsA [Thermodesulforhabdus norvegica]SFM61548.1 cell division protein FtsA [Thermodesulforhabdus norvegica]
MARGNEIIVGLDVGTTKICAVVGEVNPEGLNIIGVGTSPSYGMRGGMVINVDKTVQAIKRAVSDAQFMAGCEIERVHVGIAGTHIKSENSTGVVAIKNREVMPGDIERVMDAAQAIALPHDREILHVIPQEFIVDDQKGIMDPLGMSGVRLEVRVHIVTVASTALRNIEKCCEKAGLYVESFSLESLASSKAVLYPDEKELGVAVIDMGGGTTDIAIFSRGSVRHTAVIGLGGNNITSDISVGLRTSLDEAERIKRAYGNALASRIDKSADIRVGSVSGHHMKKVDPQLLGRIIEARVDEILTIVDWELTRSGYGDQLHAGIVLTGGVALLPGIRELAETIFELPVRIGFPYAFGGLQDTIKNPMFSTAAGLIMSAISDSEYSEKIFSRRSVESEGWLGRIWQKLKTWLNEL